MSTPSMERRLSAILSADVVGYSRLMAQAEERTVRTLISNREEISRQVSEHTGRVVDSPGDNLLAEFPSALEACRCAIAVQRELAKRNAGLPAERRMDYRIGLHLGDVMVEGGRIFGDGVNIAARLEKLADPGGICISGSVHEQVRHKLDGVYEDLGRRTVKNLPDPVQVYRLVSEAAAGAGLRRRPTWLRPALAAAVLLLAAWGASRVWLLAGSGETSSPTASSIRRIAVLPLDNLSGDPEQQYFTDGMTEALIAELGKLGDLRVTSRTSVMRYKGTRKSIREIAADLNVEGIIEGSVLRVENRVRITAQLIDARSDHHLWSESYDRELSDILALQRDVAHAVAGSIQLEVAPSAARDRSVRRIDPKAHEAYLKGMYFLGLHSSSAARKAVAYLHDAIAIDPEYPLPYSALADTYSCSPTHAWSFPGSEQLPSIPRTVMAMARFNALRALELDASRSEAHTSLGLVHMFGDWDWHAAEREFKRALELDPSRSWGHMAYGLFLAIQGRLDEALEEHRQALALDPLNSQSHILTAEIHAWRGEFDQALAHWDQAMELNPVYPDLHQSLAGILCRSGKQDRMIARLTRALESTPDEPLVLADLAHCYAVSGRRDDARQILAQLDRQSQTLYVSPMSRALVLVGLNELDQAFEALDQAYRDRSFFLITIGVDTHYKALRTDPRFGELLGRIGLPAT